MSERESNRRALVSKVEECVNLANECAVGVEAATAVLEATVTELSALAARVDAQAKWLKTVEAAIDEQADRATVLVSQVQDEARAFARMSFWNRLLWLITGEHDVSRQVATTNANLDAPAVTEGSPL